MYFSLQGKVKAARITNGLPQAFRWFGDVSAFDLNFGIDKKAKKENWSGKRLTASNLITGNQANISAQLQEFYEENLALATLSRVVPVTSGTVTAVAPDISPDGLVAGDEWILRPNVSGAVTIKDSAGTPVTLVAGTDYTIDNRFGVVTFLRVTNGVTPYTQPFRAGPYSYTAHRVLSFFTDTQGYVSIRFEGVNTADQDRPIIAEIYKVQLDPTKKLGLINAEYGELTLDGTALLDSTKPNDPVFGQFGRFIYP